MFCAALLLSCPAVEISIYSTCKRISQKILRNVMKFAMMIADQDLGEPRRARSRTPRALSDFRHHLRGSPNSDHQLQNQAREHGRDLPRRPAGEHRHPHHQQLPVKGRERLPELQKSEKSEKSEIGRSSFPDKTGQNTAKQAKRGASPVPHQADSYLAPGAIEKHVAPPGTRSCIVAFPISRAKFVTLG